MRSALIGAFTGALLVGAASFFLWVAPLREGQNNTNTRVEKVEAAAAGLARAKPRQAYITLTKSESARCLADIDAKSMGAYPGENVRWNIVDDGCRPDGPWAVTLVFEGSDLPFPLREMRIGRNGRTIPVKANAVVGTKYKYKVWMRGHNGADYELIDPDLEVEPPPFNTTVTATSPAPPPQKQP